MFSFASLLFCFRTLCKPCLGQCKLLLCKDFSLVISLIGENNQIEKTFYSMSVICCSLRSGVNASTFSDCQKCCASISQDIFGRLKIKRLTLPPHINPFQFASPSETLQSDFVGSFVFLTQMLILQLIY